MQIVVARLTDLKELTYCHKISFPNSLSSSLGNSFIEKMLSWYIVDERGIMFYIIENNEIIGYCGGIIIKQAGLPGAATSITQHSFKTFIIAFFIRPWLIFHPDILKRISFIKRNLMYKFGIKKVINNSIEKQNIEFITSWGLVVIGVKPPFQGKGAGSLLLQEFERLAKSDGVHKITLSVKSTNQTAIKSYIRNGWLIGTINQDSLNMYKEI